MVHVVNSLNTKGDNTKHYIVLIGVIVCCCTVTEEHSPVLKVISAPYRQEVRNGSRKLHNLELYN